MKCKNCGLTVKFPIYEEEVIIQRQPFFGPHAWSTKATGRTVPICPFCQESIYNDSTIRDGWIKGPRKMAEDERSKQLISHSSSQGEKR